MRPLAAAVLVVCIALPASAQEPLDPASIGPTVARDFWCATAFGVAAANADGASDTITAISLRDGMTVLFQRLLLQFQSSGRSRAEYDAVAARTLAEVLDPFRTTSGAFTRAECDGAVADAQRAIAQMTTPAPVSPEPAQ